MAILALDVGGTTIKIGEFSNKGELFQESEVPTLAHEGAKAVVERLINLIKHYDDIDKVGISCTGQIDMQNGLVVFATESLPGFSGTPLVEIVEKATRKPVVVDNDSNCAALGEAKFGAGKGLSSFICLTYGTGIGGGIIIDGKVYRGIKGIAGEAGHMITHVGGLDCVCGGKGCYEMYGSTKALLAEVRNRTGEELSGKDIFEKLSHHVIKETVDLWISEVVTGIVSLVHIFNPEAFVLGGGIMNQRYIIEKIRTMVKNEVVLSYSDVEILSAKMGNKAGIYGAYYLARYVDNR